MIGAHVKKIAKALLAAGLTAAVFGTLPASADIGQDQALELRRKGLIMPFEQVLERLQQLHPGFTLLEAELDEEDGVLVYEIEIINAAGVVRELELEARQGAVLKDEEDD